MSSVHIIIFCHSRIRALKSPKTYNGCSAGMLSAIFEICLLILYALGSSSFLLVGGM